MRVGVLTGGGDCPGLNAVIRAIVRKGEGNYGHSVIGFRHGWRGVLEDESIELDVVSPFHRELMQLLAAQVPGFPAVGDWDGAATADGEATAELATARSA